MRAPPPAPPNPFHTLRRVLDEPAEPARLVLRDDHSRAILSRNDSPDVPFTWSLNPYRGCTHACAYCYARRTHEYLDHDAGEDFERVIYVKRDAPSLLRKALARPSWKGAPLHLAGVTDPYQPVERRLRIVRGCLEVLASCRHPVSVITRSPLIERDLDLLSALAAHDAVRVTVSVPLDDEPVRRALEPGTVPVARRLAAVRALAEAGVPVGVSLAPVIPGLSDHRIASGLVAARDAGAQWAWMSLLRLPGSVEAVFESRLREAVPGRAEAVMDRLRRAREGEGMAGGGFGRRMRGSDAAWGVASSVFSVTTRRLGLETSTTPFPAESPFQADQVRTQPCLPGLFR